MKDGFVELDGYIFRQDSLFFVPVLKRGSINPIQVLLQAYQSIYMKKVLEAITLAFFDTLYMTARQKQKTGSTYEPVSFFTYLIL
ncbi:hypothetical protein AF332_04960 [Sporosarcina globispora]|uniref:Uncharacterized protein n=1 Tax=Sporosarcina globispora TaxID=1459 RepID=A0A0M0G8S3_SPOGL|nr:hypothetical protein [Sporosarcina globispora]KON86239.1 hypothetical protein AF332_04960 [Sporosarcina globispora]